MADTSDTDPAEGGFEVLVVVAREREQARSDALHDHFDRMCDVLERRGPHNRYREGIPAELWRSLA